MYRFSQLLLGLLLLAQTNLLQAQQPLRALQIQPSSSQQEVLLETASDPLFSPLAAAPRSSQLALELADYQLLQVNEEAQAQLLAAASDELRLQLPSDANGGLLDLVLHKVDILAEGFSVREAVSGDVLDGSVLGVHYRGHLFGDPNSTVAFSLSEAGGIQAIVAKAEGGNLVLGQADDPLLGPGTYVLYPDEQLEDRQSFACATPDTEVDYDPEMLRIAPNQGEARSAACVRIYLEVDYDIYQGKGGTAQAAAYVSAAFNEVAALYASINVNMTISEILVWDQPSPYVSNSSSGRLTAFQAERTSFNGDIAQLLSYGSSGGIAIVNGLCHPYVGARMSFASINSGFQTVPTYSWTVMVMAHELGHQLGSQHTHACVWNGNGTAIDGCPNFTEGNCPVPGNPSGGGNIMSYCHLTQVGINFNVGFGQQPAAVIFNTVNAASCTGTSCGGGGNPPGDGGGNPPGDGGGNPPGDGGGDPPADDCTDNTAYLRLAPDNYGPETTWSIVDESGDALASGGPYRKMLAGTIIMDTLCLPDGCYDFVLNDSYGDGICCEYGNGSYRIADGNGQILVNGSEFEERVTEEFCLPYVPGNPGNDDCIVLDFNEFPPISYGQNQDAGQISVQENGSQIYLRNNAWKAVEFDYELTAETMIEFDFRSTIQGEVHGIGFDDNLAISSQFTFRLYGTQNWGNAAFNDYPGDGSWMHFVIPVGTYLQGEATHMFFVADQDSGQRNGNSYFRNIRVYEGEPCTPGENLDIDYSAHLAPAVETLEVWPNPSQGQLRARRSLESQSIAGQFEVASATGQLVRSGTVAAGQESWDIDLSQLAPGTYWLRYRDARGEKSERFNLQ